MLRTHSVYKHKTSRVGRAEISSECGNLSRRPQTRVRELADWLPLVVGEFVEKLTRRATRFRTTSGPSVVGRATLTPWERRTAGADARRDGMMDESARWKPTGADE